MALLMTRVAAPAGPTTLDRAPLRVRLTLQSARVDAGLARRLAALGLRIGTSLEAVGRTAGGGRVVDVNGSRIALDRSVMRLLEVRPA